MLATILIAAIAALALFLIGAAHFAWGGLVLRDERVRALLLRRE